jgi:hypothetical protein
MIVMNVVSHLSLNASKRDVDQNEGSDHVVLDSIIRIIVVDFSVSEKCFTFDEGSPHITGEMEMRVKK